MSEGVKSPTCGKRGQLSTAEKRRESRTYTVEGGKDTNVESKSAPALEIGEGGLDVLPADVLGLSDRGSISGLAVDDPGLLVLGELLNTGDSLAGRLTRSASEKAKLTQDPACSGRSTRTKKAITPARTVMSPSMMKIHL